METIHASSASHTVTISGTTSIVPLPNSTKLLQTPLVCTELTLIKLFTDTCLYGFILHPFRQSQASTRHPTHRPPQRPLVGPVGGLVDEGIDDTVDEDQEHPGMVERIQKRSGQPRNLFEIT